MGLLLFLLIQLLAAAAGPCVQPWQVNTETLGCVNGSFSVGAPRAGLRLLLRPGAAAPFALSREAPSGRGAAEGAAVGAPYAGAPGPAAAAFAQRSGSGV